MNYLEHQHLLETSLEPLPSLTSIEVSEEVEDHPLLLGASSLTTNAIQIPVGRIAFFIS